MGGGYGYAAVSAPEAVAPETQRPPKPYISTTISPIDANDQI